MRFNPPKVANQKIWTKNDLELNDCNFESVYLKSWSVLGLRFIIMYYIKLRVRSLIH